MSRWLRLLLSSVAAIVLLAASQAGIGGRSAQPAVAGTPNVAVTIANFAFYPTPLTVAPGQTVAWTNTDDVGHNVVADDHSFASSYLNQGDTFSFTFNTPGTYTYECTIHPYMKGTITVAATGSASGTAPSASPSPAPASGTTPSTSAGPTATPAPSGESGGYSPSFTVSGSVASPATYGLPDLQALPAQTVTAQFTSGQGQQQHTYQGVRLYDLLMAASPQFSTTQKKDKLNWYVRVRAVDGYKAVIAWGEIDPAFEGKNVLVAYSQDGQPLGQGAGMAELVVPGDAAGGRYVSSITDITVASAGG